MASQILDDLCGAGHFAADDEELVRMRPRTAEELAAWPAVLLGEDALTSLACVHLLPLSPALPTVVLLHGWVMNRTAWAKSVEPLLQQGFGILMPDLPGHGDSPGFVDGIPAHELFNEMADRVARAMDSVGIDEAPLAAYSVGAGVALAFSARHPHRVTRLFLLNPVVRSPLRQMLYSPLHITMHLLWRALHALLRPQTALHLHALLMMLVMVLPLPASLRRAISGVGRRTEVSRLRSYLHCKESDVAVFLDGLARTDAQVTALTLRALRHPLELTIPRRGAVPLTVATGSQDSVTSPPFVFALRPPSAHAVAIIKSRGHLSVCHAPQQVGALLKRWLGNADGKPPPPLPGVAAHPPLTGLRG